MTPRLAARYAREFNCAFVPLEAARAQFQRLREACQVPGEPPGRTPARQMVRCGPFP